MNKKLRMLAQRREHLVQESSKQRVQLAQAIEVWRGPIVLVDQGCAAIRYIKNHPFYMAAISAVFIKLFGKILIGRCFSFGKKALQFLQK
jgi:hypothetical protein